MNQFRVTVEDSVGHLADMAEVLASAGVNIMAISSERKDNRNANMHFITNDEDKTRTALTGEGIKFTEEEILALKLEDKPGALFDVTTKLKGAGVNMNAIYIINKIGNKTYVAIDVDEVTAARELLHNMII